MKRDIRVWQMLGFAVVSLLGTALHFLYDWTGNGIVALFSSVNESTWEHLKLLFFPMLLFAIIESRFIGKTQEDFWCIKLRGILLGLLLIPTLFYTLRGVFGTTPDFVNILLFFVVVGIVFVYETRQFNSDDTPCPYKESAIVLLLSIAVAFALFTYMPPQIPLFQDPVDGSFGLKLH